MAAEARRTHTATTSTPSHPTLVQGTNDSSIVSKASMAALGYVDDPHLTAFVSKKARRSPIINRGYYIRCKAVDFLYETFHSTTSGPKQILSLGAGFDTSFFRLKQRNLLEDTIVYEVDFPELVQRKSNLIAASEPLADMCGPARPLSRHWSPEQEGAARALLAAKREQERDQVDDVEPSSQWPSAPEDLTNDQLKELVLSPGGMCCEQYRLIGGDLTYLEDVLHRLQVAGLDTSLPTLILSECVLTYLPPAHADKIIAWVSESFSRAALVNYEQTFPDDAFGVFMRKHFDKLHSPLRCITSYPTPEHQARRYRCAGFEDIEVKDMASFYSDILTPEERQRVDAIEPFDEHEDWLCKCQHYIISVAVKGALGSLLTALRPWKGVDAVPSTSSHHESDWEVEGDSSALPYNTQESRHGHASAMLRGVIFVFGGFGGANHRRLANLTAWRYSVSGELTKVPVVLEGTATLNASMHHTLTAVGSNKLLLVGGRASPTKPLACCLIGNVKFHEHDVGVTVEWTPLMEGPEAQLLARFRHAACALNDSTVLVCGGKDGSGDCAAVPALLIDVVRGLIVPVNASTKATARLSVHSLQATKVKTAGTSTATDVPKEPHRWTVMATGGMDNAGRVHDTIDILQVAYGGTAETAFVDVIRSSTRLQASQRISHTALRVGRHVLLVGGRSPIHNTLENAVSIIEPSTLSCHPVALQETSAAWPRKRLLHGHTCHLLSKIVQPQDGLGNVHHRLVILGGGGNCFSFGTLLDPAWTLCGLALDRSLVQQQVPCVRRPIASMLARDMAGERFAHLVQQQRVPLVVRGCSLTTEPWTAEVLRRLGGDREVSVHVGEQEKLSFVDRNFRFEMLSFGDLVQRAFDPAQKEVLYLRSMGRNFRKDVANIHETFAELADTFRLPDFVPASVMTSKLFSSALRVSSANTQLWMHYDIMDNLLCNVIGRKRLVVWPPEEVGRLYVNGSSSQVMDVDHPDLSSFPNFSNERAMEIVLEPGDLVFLPALWLHHVVSLEPCVSVNVFFRHLEPEEYAKKDLYGNKDLVRVQNSLVMAEKMLEDLKQLPDGYRRFYVEKIKSTLDKSLSNEDCA